MPTLTDALIKEKLKALPEWKREGNAIKRNYVFSSFLDAIKLIQNIAPHAEDMNHHPEIYNVYNRVTITLSTHDAGGITEKDFLLAGRIEQEARDLTG